MNIVVMDILDSEGNYVVKYRYDCWGNLLYVTPLTQCIAANHNPFLYKGYMYDEETKWYYLQSRYYIPSICRFLTPDSIDYVDPETIGGLNLYAYCGNNPVICKQGFNFFGASITTSSISVGGPNIDGGNLDIESSGSGSVINGSAPWYAQIIVGAIPDLYTCGRYLLSKGMHKYFAYKKSYYYMFPILGANHNRLAIASTNFRRMSNATFRKLVTGNAKASLGSMIGNIAGVGALTFGTNLLFNLHENGFDFTDKAMWIDTGIDTAISMGAYGLAMGATSLVTAGLAMAGVALPGAIVLGGVIILCIGFEHLIRAISGYWE